MQQLSGLDLTIFMSQHFTRFFLLLFSRPWWTHTYYPQEVHRVHAIWTTHKRQLHTKLCASAPRGSLPLWSIKTFHKFCHDPTNLYLKLHPWVQRTLKWSSCSPKHVLSHADIFFHISNRYPLILDGSPQPFYKQLSIPGKLMNRDKETDIELKKQSNACVLPLPHYLCRTE